MTSYYEKNRDNWSLFASQNKLTTEEKRWVKIRKHEMQEDWYATYFNDEYGENNEDDEYAIYGTYFDIYEGDDENEQ